MAILAAEADADVEGDAAAEGVGELGEFGAAGAIGATGAMGALGVSASRPGTAAATTGAAGPSGLRQRLLRQLQAKLRQAVSVIRDLRAQNLSLAAERDVLRSKLEALMSAPPALSGGPGGLGARGGSGAPGAPGATGAQAAAPASPSDPFRSPLARLSRSLRGEPSGEDAAEMKAKIDAILASAGIQ